MFASAVGETPVRFLQRIRLERSARQLVYAQSDSIGDIAYDNGFASVQSFSTAFHRWFDVAPRDYRASNQFKFSEYWAGREFNGRSQLDIELGNDRAVATPKITIEHRPQIKLAYLRFIGPYGELGRVSTKFELLRQWARQRNLLRLDSHIVSISWDNPNVTHPNHCRLNVGLPITAEIPDDRCIGIQTVTGGTFAVLHVDGENRDVQHSWEYFLASWLPMARYAPRFAAWYEVYAPSDDGCEHFFRTICLPDRRI